jgi:hypothetical protein
MLANQNAPGSLLLQYASLVRGALGMSGTLPDLGLWLYLF